MATGSWKAGQVIGKVNDRMRQEIISEKRDSGKWEQADFMGK